MSEFKYQEPFPLSADTTEYRLLTKDYVKVVECDGRKVLKVDPKGLELLSKEAFADVSVLPACCTPAETVGHPQGSRSH